jgi:hypothetical protein
MLFLSILDAMNMSAEDFSLKGDASYCTDSVIDAKEFDLAQLPDLSKSICRCLEDCYVMQSRSDGFIIAWDCFVVYVTFKDGKCHLTVDLCDEVPFDFD